MADPPRPHSARRGCAAWLRPLVALLAGFPGAETDTVDAPPEPEAVARAAAAPEPAPPEPAMVDFHAWRTAEDVRGGMAEGVAHTGTGLVISRPVGTIEHADPGGVARAYEFATWTSPPHEPGFAATELVASWNAETPPGTWLRVEVSGRTSTGARTRWYAVGRWAAADSDILRASVPGQSDAYGAVDVDTVTTTPDVALRAYQLRVTLFRRLGTSASPRVTMVGAMASALPGRFTVPSSEPRGTAAVELLVPRYSQEVHRGHYPRYDGGGESWCSPASTQMVVEYWGCAPSRRQLSWVRRGYADPSVAHAARCTYDHAYRGAGNWSFNVAYAATYGLDAHVTRLRSLSELEDHLRRGIPVITSQSFRADELDGANYETSGHLMVVVGVTAAGDVIVNDPAAPDNESVRRVYRRRQFENVWLRTRRYAADGSVRRGSGGVVYLIRPAE